MGMKRLSHAGSLSCILTTKEQLLLGSRCVWTLFTLLWCTDFYLELALLTQKPLGPHTVCELFHQAEDLDPSSVESVPIVTFHSCHVEIINLQKSFFDHARQKKRKKGLFKPSSLHTSEFIQRGF